VRRKGAQRSGAGGCIPDIPGSSEGGAEQVGRQVRRERTQGTCAIVFPPNVLDGGEGITQLLRPQVRRQVWREGAEDVHTVAFIRDVLDSGQGITEKLVREARCEGS
jgi:hypothetical protein